KNQVDAEVMVASLAQDGYESVENAEDASIILVNTCGFIESARQESIETFFALKENFPDKKILVTGCLSQRYAAELDTDLVEADAIFGNRDLASINKVVRKVVSGERVIEVPEYPEVENDYDSRGKLFNYPGSAYLKISEGCNHRCRFCAIPIIRGSLRSRPKSAVLEDATRLIEQGVKEINIIAQDLAAYGTDTEAKSSTFLDLLESIALLQGDFVIRLLYIHPDAFPLALLDVMKKYPKILPYFDIPFQHADTKVLRKMGRVGDKETYLNLIKTIRSSFPDAVIRSTFLLGFTYEDEQAIETLYAFIKEANLDYAGTFIFSLEEGTPSYNDVEIDEYNRRVKKALTYQKKVNKLTTSITMKRLERFVGREMDVLIEELVEQEELAIGRTHYQAPEVDGLTVVMGKNLVPGSYVRCGIKKVNGIDLEAIALS
ncbi:MAG: 30S ribosomal protein S12 methylthiotransferase RimO, partial [Spirochaetia bacterium]|nr:30S ribosomal protein S12 methylthiotransferase RimO [Spirochaetia bacterium]